MLACIPGEGSAGVSDSFLLAAEDLRSGEGSVSILGEPVMFAEFLLC